MKIKFNISTILRVICVVLLATQLFFVGSPDQASNTAIAYEKSICTRDINKCGHASICACPDGTTYSPVVGLCVRDLL